MDPLRVKYSYKDAPTLASFARSNAFMRCIIGPFGSGKTSCCVAEVARRGLAQNPGPDGIRRTRVPVVRNCYDDETEILTEQRGWQLFRHLTNKDRVAMRAAAGEMVFVKPALLYAAPYKGEMICISQKNLDLCVTPDHNLFTATINGRTKKRAPYKLESAELSFGKTNREFTALAGWRGTKPKGFDLRWFAFLGLWFAEGSAGIYRIRGREHRRLAISQKKYATQVEALLIGLGLKFTRHDKGNGNFNFVLSLASAEMKKLCEFFAKCGKRPIRRIPNDIKAAPPEYLRTFLRWFILGDGHLRRNYRETTRMWTSSRLMADDLQEIAVKAGYAAAVSKNREPGPHCSGCWIVTLLTYGRATPAPQRKSWSRIPYDGMVYCVEVPMHVVYVRRNGKAIWCGQTMPMLRDTTMKTFCQWLPPGVFGDWLESKHEFHIKAFENTIIEVLFRALDRPDHVRNILSLDATFAWISEAREVPWAIIEAMQGRVDRFPPISSGGATWAGIFMDTNAPEADSKMVKFYEEEKHPPGFAAIFKQPSGLSPEAENLPNLPGGRRYYERLAIGKSDEWIKVYVHGQYGFIADGEAVFPEYNDSIHCVDGLSTSAAIPVYRAFDFGLTPACLFGQLTPQGRLIVVDELTTDDGISGIDKFSDRVLEHSAQYYKGREFVDVADPAGMSRAETDERSCFEIMRAKGMQVQPGVQTITIRLESVRKLLMRFLGGKPPIYGIAVHPRCKMLRKALMGGYHYRRVLGPDGRLSPEPDKNRYSHIADCLEYMCAEIVGDSLTMAPIEEERYDPRYDPAYSDETRNPITGY